MTSRRRARGGAGSLGLAVVAWAVATADARAIESGVISVQQNSTANTAAAVTLTTTANTAGFAANPAGPTNRADFGVIIGGNAADDVANGILLTSVANNGRNNAEATPLDGTRYGVSGVGVSGGGWWVPVSDAITGSEYNFNVSAVYFPFAEGWITAHAYVAAGSNGADLDSIRTGPGAAAVALGGSTGNRLVAPGTTLAPVTTASGGTSGRADLFLTGVNSRTDGLLFVNHGKDEANYALSRPSADGTRFEIGIHDSNANGASYEQDPIALAYVPYGTAGLVMGRIASQTSGTTTVYGARAITSQGEFSVQRVASGSYQLKIPGKTTADGTLLVSAAGFEGTNSDNIVSFAPLGDGTGWVIETRDLPLSGTAGIAGQDLPDAEPVFDFLFAPKVAAPTAPGSRLGYRSNRVAAANYFVTEFASGNTASDMTAGASVGTSGLGTFSTNRGDNAPGIGGAAIPLNTSGGPSDVLLASASQGFRDNPLGSDGYGLATVWNSSGTYVVATANNSDAEINMNFAAAHFPATAGFVQAPSVATTSGQATVALDPAAGLLMATPLVNAGNLATIEVTGNAHVVNVVGGTGTRTSTTPFGYVFLPNDTPGLVSGRVTGATGTVTSGADTGSATLTRTATGVYSLTLAGGRSADSGMLLVNGLAAGAEYDNFVVWEKAGSGFTIRVLDAATTPAAVDGDFQFAYVPYDQSLAKTTDLSAGTAAVSFGSALVGAMVPDATVAVTATSPQSFTVTSYSAARTSGTTAVTVNAGATGTIRGDVANQAAAAATPLSLGLSTATSGAVSATVTLSNLTTGSDTTNQTIAVGGTVYDRAAVAANQLPAVGSGGGLSLSNASGTFRAAAGIVTRSITGAAGWSVSGFAPGTMIAAGGTASGIATFDPTGRLNGTYDATFAIDLQHADQSLIGAAAGDLGQVTWSLSQQITGVAAETGAAGRRSGDSYAGLGLTRGQGRNTVATILAGQAGGSRTVQFDFRDAASAPVLSDILELKGTAGDPIVLTVGYDESLLGGTAEAALRLGWLDENGSSPTFNQWIPAIAGNSANPVALQEPFAGSWDAYWATFTAANPSATLADARGAHGVDAAANTSWAVVDHNSSFAVIPVPEPAETGLVCVGLGGLFFALRRRSRA